MDGDFIKSLEGLPESEIEAKLKEDGWERSSVPFMMANGPVSQIVLPQGSQRHTEVLVLDYSILRPKQYDPHQCYAIYERR